MLDCALGAGGAAAGIGESEIACATGEGERGEATGRGGRVEEDVKAVSALNRPATGAETASVGIMLALVPQMGEKAIVDTRGRGNKQ